MDGSCAVAKDRTEEVKVVRNRLMWKAYLLLGTMVTSGPRLLPRTMSGHMVLPQPGSMWTPTAHDATKGHIEAQVLCV